jgi:tetratricopeptide (TPR) repeat protein
VRRITVLLPLLLLHAASAHALTLLTEAKHGVFRHDAATGSGSAQISVGRDRALASLEDPTVCPSSASLRIAFYPTATNLVTGGPEVALPCERWRRIPGGYLYRDSDGSAGGVRTVRYTTRGLSVDARSPGFTPVVGPVGYVQLWLTVGSTRYLVRLHDFVSNEAEDVVSRRASRDGAAGEAAFWDTLWGDADRHEDALRFLARAVARDRRDARSHFLIAMQYLNLYGQQTADLNHPSDRAKRLVEESRAAFDRAVPLLWDGAAGDSRVPGFAAAATYAKGVGFRDAALTAQGVDELEYATSINTLFNSFDLLAVAPAVSNKDPLYARVIDLLDVTFPEVATYCSTQQEICFNDGMAPHNLEGTFILFGDIYAKGGRTESARGYYGSALSLGEQSGWDPHFVAAVRDRLETLEQRVALYQDDDPRNDPPFVGAGGAGSCAYCHRK